MDVLPVIATDLAMILFDQIIGYNNASIHPAENFISASQPLHLELLSKIRQD